MKYIKTYEKNNDINWSLIMAVEFDNKVSKVKNLIDSGADINFKDIDNENRTPLFHAINRGRYEIIDYLIENGADINYQDDDGMTPLMVAGSELNSFEVIQKLINSGADWFLTDNNGDYFIEHTFTDYQDMIEMDYPEKWKEYLMRIDAKTYNI